MDSNRDREGCRVISADRVRGPRQQHAALPRKATPGRSTLQDTWCSCLPGWRERHPIQVFLCPRCHSVCAAMQRGLRNAAGLLRGCSFWEALYTLQGEVWSSCARGHALGTELLRRGAPSHSLCILAWQVPFLHTHTHSASTTAPLPELASCLWTSVLCNGAQNKPRLPQTFSCGNKMLTNPASVQSKGFPGPISLSWGNITATNSNSHGFQAPKARFSDVIILAASGTRSSNLASLDILDISP